MEFHVFQFLLNVSSLSVALHLAICLSVLGHQWQLTRPALPLPVFAGCPGCFFIKQSRQTLSAPFLWLSGGGFLAIWGALELLLSQWFLFCHLLGCQGSGLMNFPLIRLTVSGCARPKILLTKCKLVSTLLVLCCSHRQ